MGITIDPKMDLLHFRQPFMQRKIERSRELIAAGLKEMRQPYVAFSGGKDSLVCLALVLEQAPEITVLWSDDELEYDETVTYNQWLAREWDFRFVITAGWATHGGWFCPWREEPYWREQIPGTMYTGELIESWTPKQGYDGTFLGLRQDEAIRRRIYLRSYGRLHQCADGTWRCNPLGGWSVADVWAVIAGLGLPYNPVYDILASVGVPRNRQRVGPLPLTPGWHLKLGWHGLYERLTRRYGNRW